MATPFSTAFVKLRRDAGFETAYQFFFKNGGPKVFKCSFPNYLRIEKGSHLPQPARLPLLCTLLRLPLGSNELRHIVKTYLETWLGSQELADWMLAPLAKPAEGAAILEPAQQALHKLVKENAKPLSVAQYEAVMATPASYWCFRVLTTSKNDYTPQELSDLLEIAVKEIETALEALRKKGIALRLKNGRFKSPLAGAFLLFPDSQLIAPGLMKKVFQYNEAMVQKRGHLLDVRYCGVRADADRLQGFIPHFREAIRGVNAYSVVDKTDQSALFFVEGRIYKLFDF